MDATVTLQPPTYGQRITILSIDGGGIRGLIQAPILIFLESELQKIDGEEARIADYFDVIAGTSAGGLITTMLTAPDEKNRPLYAAKSIKDFLFTHGPKIFPHNGWLFGSIIRMIKTVFGPKYNGKYLQKLLRDELGTRRLDQTLTNVVIPTFDIKNLQPTIFSSYQVKKKPSIDAFLSDICISTSAAPTFLPAHYFQTRDSLGKTREFNLIDGGVAANNPTLVAIGEVKKEIMDGSSDFFTINPRDYKRYLVISLGSGSPKSEQKYTAQQAAKWGVFGWLTTGSATPLVDVFTQASSDMVDIHLNTVFQSWQHEEFYLRIQDGGLTGDLASLDITTKKNMDGLVEFGEALLKKPVSRVNLDTGLYEEVSEETNEEALRRFAKLLSQERTLRHAKSPKGHQVTAFQHRSSSNGVATLQLQAS